MSTHRPMEGIRILDLADHTFVPAASAILSDWGAEVIKIEHITRGDAARGLGATGMAIFAGPISPILEHANRGKLSLALDLNQEEGRDILYQLAGISDVFLTNKLPSVREKLKTDVHDIRAHNPNIIYVSGSGFGARGPDRDAGGYDMLGFWYRGASGLTSATRDADSVPGMPGPAYGDSIGAMTIAGGIATALFHRERTGEVDVVDVSLMSTGMWAMGAGIAVSKLAGMPWHELVVHAGGKVSNPLVGCYRTGDGKYLALSMLQGFHYWPEACERFGVPELIDDPRFDTNEHFIEHAAVAAGLVAEAVARKTLADWKERLSGMRGQWCVVLDTIEVTDDPQTVANGYVQELQSKDGHPFTLVSTPVQYNGAPAPTARAPEFNEHGDEILREKLGLDWDAILDLKVKGVVG
jgi:crotonobetainyl-CoA:carnitine CoA-transferase CaiB-like acyl-CoA transferase